MLVERSILNAAKKGKSNKTVSKNISELTSKKPSKRRSKAIKTLSDKQGISLKEAKKRQAIAIAMSKAGKKRKK